MAQSRQPRTVLVAVITVLILVLCCCGGLGWVGFLSTHTLAESYAQSRPARIGEVSVELDVRALQRVENGWGGRLTGPPYEFAFLLRDAGSGLSRAILHQVEIVDGSRGKVGVPVTNGDNPARDDALVMLYARHEGSALPSPLKVEAEIETFTASGNRRERLLLSFHRTTRATLNIP